MLANLGDITAEEGVQETRTVRILETPRDNLEQEVLEMEVDGAVTEGDEAGERTVAMGRGRGRDQRGKHRDN